MKNDWVIILLDNGSMHLETFKKFPQAFQWGRPGEVPTTYMLDGHVYTTGSLKFLRKIRIYLRREHVPGELDKPMTDEEIGKFVTVIDQDHTYSENLKFREQKNYMIIFGVLFGIMVGALIMSIISKTV